MDKCGLDLWAKNEIRVIEIGSLIILNQEWSLFTQKGDESNRLQGPSVFHGANTSMICIDKVDPRSDGDAKIKVLTHKGQFWTWLKDIERESEQKNDDSKKVEWFVRGHR